MRQARDMCHEQVAGRGASRNYHRCPCVNDIFEGETVSDRKMQERKIRSHRDWNIFRTLHIQPGNDPFKMAGDNYDSFRECNYSWCECGFQLNCSSHPD